MRKVIASVVVVATVLLACSSEGKVGEECDESGKVDGECEDGLVCGQSADSSASLKCLKQCTDQSQCAAGEDCNGVSGTSIKGCRPKTSTK